MEVLASSTGCKKGSDKGFVNTENKNSTMEEVKNDESGNDKEDNNDINEDNAADGNNNILNALVPV